MKRYLLIVLFLLTSVFAGGWGMLNDMNGPLVGCDDITPTENDDTYYSIITSTCQKVKYGGADCTIGSVKFKVMDGGSAGNAHIEIWPTQNVGSGSQIGGDSETLECGANVVYEWTWTSNNPVPTDDFWACIIEHDNNLYLRYVYDETTYEDTNYDLWAAGSEVSGSVDAVFGVTYE